MICWAAHLGEMPHATPCLMPEDWMGQLGMVGVLPNIEIPTIGGDQ